MEDQMVAEAKPLVPAWTLADFMTDAPYEYLYSKRDNKYLLQKMLNVAQQMAKAVKFSGFMKTWTAYVEANSPQATVMGSYQTEFTDQPIQLASGKYICDDSGVRCYGRMGEEIVVCTHPILPTKRLVSMDTGNEKLEVYFKRGNKGNWRHLIAGKDVTASGQKIISLAEKGIAVNSENAKQMVQYLTEVESMNYDNIPQQDSTGHLGWLPDGHFSPYCDGVVYDGDSPEFQRMFAGFTETGSEDVWMQIAKDTRSGRSVPARIALAASFAAPLVKQLNALPFFVHLWGTQGCGKTVGLMLAASVWGNPEVGQYIKTFGGTKVSQEIYASFCGNVPIILDELQIISDRKTFDDIIYMLCEGVSKGRGSKDGGLQRQRLWSSTIITSAEMPIVQSNSGGGAAVRTIEVNYGGEPLFPDSRAVAETLKHNFGFAGRKFIASIQSEGTLDVLRDIQKKYYNELSGDIQDKQVLSASILLAADKLADIAIFHDGKALTVADIKPYLITKEQADVNARAYDWLCGYIASNPVRFEEAENLGELWGKIEEEDGKDVAYIIKSAFDKIFQTGGFSVGSFLTWAKRKGLLKTSASRPDKNTVQKRFGKRLTSCVALTLQSEEQLTTEQKLIEIQNDDDMPF